MDHMQPALDFSKTKDQEVVSQGESSDLGVVLVDPKSSIERAEQDLDYLAALCFAEHMKFLFPDMFIIMWQLLKDKIHLNRDFSQIALGIPRGFAKTTFIKLWIVYCILFSKKSFILVISYAEDHAQSIIKDVCSMLAAPNVIALFGDFQLNMDIDQAGLKTFRFRGRKIILKAVGAKGGIRGLNHEHYRPDLMIFEDYQKKAESANEDISRTLYEDMVGTAMKANSPFGCLYIYVGNMYATPGAILKKLKENQDWISLVVGAIKSDGTSLWEELHPIELLLQEYEKDLRAGVPQVFLAEKLNDETAGIKSGFDITRFPECPYELDELPQGRAVVIDPALDNPMSDYNGIGLIGLYDGTPVVESIILSKFNPYQLIKEALILAFQNGCRLICVENVAYQASLLFWFGKICTDNGIEGFHFMPLNIGVGSKNAKIISMLRDWQGLPRPDATEEEQKKIIPKLYYKQACRPLVINEVIKFNPTKKNNQDTSLDIGVLANRVIEQHRDLMYMPYEEGMQAVANAAPREIEDNCLF